MTKKKAIGLTQPILKLPRGAKRLIVLTIDIILCVFATWLAFFLRLDESIRLYGEFFWRADWASLLSIAIALPLFVTHGFYRVIFRHANLLAIHLVVRAFILYALAYVTVVTIIGIPGIPRTVGIMQPLLLMLCVGVSRAVAHYWLGGAYRAILKRATLPKALIYGAGDAGRQLAKAMNNSQEMKVVGFLDDDARLQGQVMNGLRVYGPEDLAMVATDKGISTVLLALPSISRHRRNEILATIKEVKVAVRTLPSISDLAQGKVTVSDLRALDIEDLLGRDPVPPNQTLLGKNIANKVVLVTGAGGSIGSELCRQIADIGPKQLVLFEQSEYTLYQIHAEIERKLQSRSTLLTPLLGSVQDEKHMTDVMNTIKPDTVYHAAAYKHVPLVEHNVTEGIKNNVFGTLTTANAAIAANVADFVLISTDKAVRPTNVMGASKRLAEMVLQALATTNTSRLSAETKDTPDNIALSDTKPTVTTTANTTAYSTRLSMVRFGNVLGSSGSVVPKFRQQIRDGGPVTVTHPEVTRYFMTVQEAAQLVVQAGAMAEGGDVYVLDMGEPVKIFDLAKRMIELSGLTVKDTDHPTGDIEVSITGLRPGEKLYEELLIGDNPQATKHPRIMRASEDYLTWPILQARLESLQEHLTNGDPEAIKQLLRELVVGYQPNGLE